MNKIKEKLALVPTKPGSYQMKNKDGVIIYVGKAKNLKNRLKSYFTGTVTGKTKMLVDDIDDFDYIVTTSELESLILEITLIKKYNPKYNILLKDDKTYPYIELTNEKYPVLKVIRNAKRKKDKNGNQFAYLDLYTPFGIIEATIWSKQLKQHIDIVKKGKCVTIKGRKREGDHLFVEEMKTYEQWALEKKLEL